MSSNLTSEYTIDLQIRDDKSKDAIRELEKGLKEVGNIAKKAANGSDMAKSLQDAQSAANRMIRQIGELSKDTTLDVDSIVKAYGKSSQKAVAALETQYARLKDEQNKIAGEHTQLTEKLKEQQIIYRDIVKHGGDSHVIAQQIRQLEEQIGKLGYGRLESQIRQNREIRASLVASAQQAKLDAAMAKKKAAMQKEIAKLTELQAKRDAATQKNARKALDEQIKRQKVLIKSMEQAEKVQQACAKQQDAITNAINKSEKAQSRLSRIFDRATKGLQIAYNATGMVGGVGRMVAGGARAITSGLSMVSDASNRAVEREHAANRVKGMSADEASAMLGDIYVRTGADYSTIVDAINRVRSVLGNAGRDEIAQAAAIEVRYPGMSLAFASTETKANMDHINAYANRMRAVQKATGASDEQIQASAQKMANYDKSGAFDSASVTEMQAIYLGLQNSGAFETQEELDTAFDRFVRDRRGRDEPAWKTAEGYDWTKTMPKSRDRLQVANTLQKTMNWKDIRMATNTEDRTSPGQTAAERTAERMRGLEERRNQMLIKLVDILEPIIDEFSKLLDSDKITKIVNGLVKFLAEVVPLLATVLAKIAEKIEILTDDSKDFFRRLDDAAGVDQSSWFSSSSTKKRREAVANFFGFANGGIALGPSLVGERGPEAIIPLDYSRSQRAENIAYSIQNNFSMSGNQTTALALAEAVSSRDFSRAMGRAAFKAGRLGAF